MKPKFRKYLRRAIPSLIVIPAMATLLPSVSQAAIIVTDSFGNVTLNDNTNNGPNTIRADGGTSLTPTVVLSGAVSLTGDVGETEVLEITSAGYTVTNAGSLNGTNHDGIFSNVAFTLVNSGTIEGNGIASSGIVADNAVTISNNGSGSITGLVYGVDVLDGLTLTNQTNATITGRTSHGIIAFDNATITNYGTISGGLAGAGIYAGILADIYNYGTIETFGEYAINLEGDGDIYLDYGSIIDGSIEGGGSTTLSFLDGQIDVWEDRNIVYGDVYGMETINKDGPGFAFIGETGDSYWVEADSINVYSGGLFINGDVFGFEGNTQITVDGFESVMFDADDNPIAELGGTSSELGWDADIELLNGGGISAGSTPIDLTSWNPEETTWNPEDTVGTLTIYGDVTHDLFSESYIRVNIIPQAEFYENGMVPGIVTGIENGVTHDTIYNFGYYDVGNADIRITPTNDWQVISDGTYTIIDSNNPIIGADDWDGRIGVQFSESGNVYFNTVLTEYFTTVETEDGDTNVVLYIQHDYEGLGAVLGSNEAALGAALDASVTNPLMQEFIAELDYSDIFTVNETLSSLVPSGVFGLTAGVMNSNYRLHRLAQNHLATTRSGGTVFETAPDTVDAKGHTVRGGTTTSSSASGMGNVWGTFSYDWQDWDNGDGEVAAFTVGFDFRVAPNFLIGLMLDGSRADYDYQGGSSDVDSLRAAVYATYGESTGIYADFLVGYGDHDYDLDRRLGGLLSGVRSSSSTDATSLQAMAVVGYAMQADTVKHGPFVGLEYQNVDVDSYNQGGLLPIRVSGNDVDSLRGLIGYRVEATNGNFSPYASIAYAHEFEDGSQSTTATLPGGARFRVRGEELDSAILLGLGTGYRINSNLGVNIGYRGEISTGDGLDSHGGSIGLNYTF